MIHHVQMACPPGVRGRPARLLRRRARPHREPKPPALAARGGCWFAGHGIELHLGVEEDFRPARKAHPVYCGRRRLDELAARLTAAGYPVRWAADDEVPGLRRFHTQDPHGNRLEFLAAPFRRSRTRRARPEVDGS